MEITEVPIRPREKNKIKISKGIQLKINSYLTKKDISQEQLNPEQFDCLVKYMKSKRFENLMILVYALGAIVFGLLSLMLYSITLEIAVESIPTKTIVIDEKGGKTIEEINQEDTKIYAKAIILLGVTLGGTAYAFASSLGHAIGRSISLIIGKCKTRRIFDAFLPALRDQITTDPQNPTKFERSV